MINGLTPALARELFAEANQWWIAEDLVGYLPPDSRIRKLSEGTFPYISIVTLKAVCAEIFRLVALDILELKFDPTNHHNAAACPYCRGNQ